MFCGGLNVWLIPSWQMTRIEYFYYTAELCFRNAPVHCEQKPSTLATPAPGYCYQYSWAEGDLSQNQSKLNALRHKCPAKETSLSNHPGGTQAVMLPPPEI